MGSQAWVSLLYEAGVSAKTAKRCLKIFDEQAFYSRLLMFRAINSASKTKKYFLKNSTIGNPLLF